MLLRQARAFPPAWLDWRPRVLISIVILLVGTCTTANGALPRSGTAELSQSAAQSLGKRIYRQGIVAAGQPMSATVQGDASVEGAQLLCGNCHGRSGLGQGEGSIFMPPITGGALYQPREIRHKKLYGARTLRPAYTDESLARAIREGVDPGGRVLDPMMPRYALGDEELGALTAYLKTLSSSYSPGVTDTHIHFATVISADADPEKRRTMLEVLETFVENKNAGTRLETKRAVNPPYFRAWHYRGYRKWALHVWELSGPPGSWRKQLEKRYREQPVFALISGIGAGSWAPVHAFCEQNEVPCLLPNTDLPVVSEAGYYSLYFSKGMTLEAQALAKHVHQGSPTGPIVQVYREDARGMAAAAALRDALEGYGITDIHDRQIEGGGKIPSAFWRNLLEDTGSDTGSETGSPWLVLWLSDGDVPALDSLAESTLGPDRIYLSSTLLDSSPAAIQADIQTRIYAVHPFDLPEDAARRHRRIGVWLRGKGIRAGDPRVQMNVLFTATLVAQALKHVGGNFHRDYFLERIEHILDSMVMPSAYPNLSLAPTQRFASKGCYIVKLSERSANAGSRPSSEWIVP